MPRDDQRDAPKDDPRARILDAAEEAFAAEGFARASTNAICEAAGVSKGLVFHYFESKAGLYLAALDRASAALKARMESYGGDSPRDFFAAMTDATMAKLRASLELPAAYSLVYDAYVNTPREAAPEIRARLAAAFADSRARLGQSLGPEAFRPGVDRDRALDLIYACLRGLTDGYMERLRALGPSESLARIDDIRADMEGTLSLLREALLA